MAEELSNQKSSEQLKAENEFIKMKLMLEYGAKFGGEGTEELPPEVENEFLNNVLAYEEQHKDRKPIKIFEKLGQPQQFKPSSEIPDNEIETAWKELRRYMGEHEIFLDACSPNIGARELYRFTVEELFEHEIDDMQFPGMATCFIYDEFHPDPLYESAKAVTEDLLPGLFTKEPVNDYFLCLHSDNILVNGKPYVESKDVKDMFNEFKKLFTDLRLEQTTVDQCNVIEPKKTIVTGSYRAVAKAPGSEEDIILNGTFNVELQPDDLGYWSIKAMQIDAIGLLQ